MSIHAEGSAPTHPARANDIAHARRWSGVAVQDMAGSQSNVAGPQRSAAISAAARAARSLPEMGAPPQARTMAAARSPSAPSSARVHASSSPARAAATHAWYKATFADYPASRRALLPFVW